jgi:hypothetical protein
MPLHKQAFTADVDIQGACEQMASLLGKDEVSGSNPDKSSNKTPQGENLAGFFVVRVQKHTRGERHAGCFHESPRIKVSLYRKKSLYVL